MQRGKPRKAKILKIPEYPGNFFIKHGLNEAVLERRRVLVFFFFIFL